MSDAKGAEVADKERGAGALSIRQAASIVFLGMTLGGCATPTMEVHDVSPHAVPTSIGTGWVYRSNQAVEPILAPGLESKSLESDMAYLAMKWGARAPGIAYRDDGQGKYGLLTFTDTETRRINPLMGGPLSWDIARMADGLKGTAGMAIADSPQYSIHLLATVDDWRPRLPANAVAQVRLRRIADALMQYGADPRVITGQVVPRTPGVSWKFAIALRPYQYGTEQASHSLIAPWSL